jgi:hypothetical protein
VTDPPLPSPAKLSLQSPVCTENCVASAAEPLRIFHLWFVPLCNAIDPVICGVPVLGRASVVF